MICNTPLTAPSLVWGLCSFPAAASNAQGVRNPTRRLPSIWRPVVAVWG